jgi:hypothetical protein
MEDSNALTCVMIWEVSHTRITPSPHPSTSRLSARRANPKTLVEQPTNSPDGDLFNTPDPDAR